ncbi:MAG: TonB-dependent receptor plug domain-containing protein [Bacteroidaceae bacterium]|nr:TonB-dependent receptor plug domain-containing protein [Bacteroidaceae bacterium]
MAQKPNANINHRNTVAKKGNTFRVTLHIDDDTNQPLILGRCELQPLGVFAATNMNGDAVFTDVPAGEWTLKVTYVGMEPLVKKINVNGDIVQKFVMAQSSLAINEVIVTAQQKESGASSNTFIGRQAIDHLQATSLADVMQLIPGQVMGNTDLTSKTNLQLRTLVNNNTSAFGSSVVVDGIPMSNNGNVSQGAFSSTAFTGTDLRQIGADNIDNVEIIRGIPSAEYGDLTSGLVVVHSKAGVTPWQAKAKITPELQNYSLGKGLRMKDYGVLNFNVDYAKAWGDPRQKTRSFNRYNVSVGYDYDLTKKWHTDTKVKFMKAVDWTGNDPDAIDDGTYSRNSTTSWSFSHRGRISANKRFMQTLSYTAGLSLTYTDNVNSSYVSNTTGLLPIITAMETGYYSVPWMTTSYLATGITECRPGNLFLKVNDAFSIYKNKTRQNFKVGLEYHYDWNNGRGYYNENESLPYKPNSDGRPRAFSDIPGLHQINAYAEDNFCWEINKTNELKINLGFRYTSMQPWSEVSTSSLSPRLNASFSLTKWLTLRSGIGVNSKTPGLDYIYPDKKYSDRVAVNYMPQDDAAAQLLVYHTQVYDVKMSKDLKNATTTKIEGGLDAKLPWGGNVSLLFYQDKTPNGFGNATEYTTYYSNVYDESALNIVAGQPTTVNYDNPSRRDLVVMTTGKIGNTNSTVNRGIEMDINFGEIKPIYTTFFLSGAYQYTKTWSTDLNTSSVRSALLPASYSSYKITPFKVIYPSGLDYNMYKRFLNTLRIVTHIPRLKMVASFTTQAIWYNWNHNYVADKNPIGWIDANLVSHDITSDMMNGYIGMDGIYYANKPEGQYSVLVSDLTNKYTDNIPTKNPVTWNMSMRLTKELGKLGGLSVYVNNCLYYEPYLTNNITTTLTQRNVGTFSFGAELFLNL